MSSQPYHETRLNVGNAIFPQFNDKKGLMICGYEYGYSKHDEYLEKECQDTIKEKTNKLVTFFDKAGIYNSPYDMRIIKWFGFFGHPLGIDGGYSNFDKCLLQTNWCDSQGNYVNDYEKFLAKENIENFLKHVENYMPSVLMFMGSKLINYLQNEAIKVRFIEIFGEETSALKLLTKEFSGRKFKIGFQSFQKTMVISFPHPSGTHGLRDDYIKLFTPEISAILENYKQTRCL